MVAHLLIALLKVGTQKILSYQNTKVIGLDRDIVATPLRENPKKFRSICF